MRYEMRIWRMIWCFVVGVIPLAILVGGCGDTNCTCPESQQPPVVFPPASVWADSSGILVSFEVDARGLPTLCDCVYDTTLPLSHTSNPVNVEGGYGAVAVNVGLPDAEFDTEYLFRCRAYSEAGTTYTTIDSFVQASFNELPMTALSLSPDGGDTNGNFRFRLNWFGWDPDGWIDHFDIRTEVDFVQGDWVSVVSTDSIFFLGPEVTVYWMFSVRAVDNLGAVDPNPETVVLIPEEWEIVPARPQPSSRGYRERPN
jgi:hypothetical protein